MIPSRSPKRPLDDASDSLQLKDATPSKFAKLHGRLVNLSPMKDANFFDGRIGDSSGSMRIVGFSSSKQRALAVHHDNSQPVLLEGCEIKKSDYGNKELEVIVRNFTKVSTSPRKIDVQSAVIVDSETTSTTITLDQLAATEENVRVCVNVKVMKLFDNVEIKPGLLKQDAIISDLTGTARLTLWCSDIGKVLVDECYCIRNVNVKEFKGVKYLGTTRGSAFELLTGNEVIEDVVMPVEDEIEIKNGVIASVSLKLNSICCTCNGVLVAEDVIGYCGICHSKQRLDRSKKHISAKLIISTEDTTVELSAYLNTIQFLVGEDVFLKAEAEISKILLFSEAFNVIYSSEEKLISKIWRD